MNLKLKSVILGSGLAWIVFQVAIHLLGYLSAVALPISIAEWAVQNSAQIFVLFVWDLLVVQLFGIGLLTAFAIYLLLRYTSLSWLYVGGAFIVTETIISNYASWTSLSWQFFSTTNLIMLAPHLIVISVCALTAARWSNEKQVAV